jgi:Fe-S-cluster containining protein
MFFGMGSKEVLQTMKLETDLKTIQKLSKEKGKENWKFRSFLKGYDADPEEIDSIVHKLNQSTSSQIDCTTCANCCKQVLPILNQKDIKRFSSGLGVTVSQFKKRYLKAAKEPGKFTFKKTPCPFLENNLCSHYEFRPKDCESFPHLYKKDFVFRLWNVIENSSICPIVYNVYEHLKDKLWRDYHNDFFNDYDYHDEFE